MINCQQQASAIKNNMISLKHIYIYKNYGGEDTFNQIKGNCENAQVVNCLIEMAKNYKHEI
jgi:hypothetical protein